MSINMNIVNITNAVFFDWTSLRLFAADVVSVDIVEAVKNSIAQNDIEHIFIIFLALNIIYEFRANSFYDFLMLEHDLTANFLIDAISTTHVAKIYLNLKCDTDLTALTIIKVISFRDTFIELIVINAV